MPIESDVFVTLRITVSRPDGEVVDAGAEPVRYLHGGHGGLFPKLEAALDGKAVGDSVQVTLQPADAFGEHDPALVVAVPVDRFDAPPQPGDEIERDYGGVTWAYRVTAVDGAQAVLDANHPQAGMALVFSATVVGVRAATAEEVAGETAALAKAAVAGRASRRAFVRAKDEAEAEAEAGAEAARAEAAGLVQNVYVPQLGFRFRFVFRSETHKLCWLAPLFLLPALATWLGLRGWQVACGAVVVLWLVWSFFAPAVIRMAIDRWGYRFLFFDFSPNLEPSGVERGIVNGGGGLSVLAVIAYTVVALWHLEHLSDLLAVLGLDFVVFAALGIPLMILLPFLVMLLTAFRIRPVIDKVAAK